jgi:D-arabinose 5-phosphate isomerase GutQ
MQSALHIQTQVLQGHKIEIENVNLPEGDTVDVFVVLSESGSSNRASVVNLIEKIRSHRSSFRSAEDIDQRLQEERNSWED